MKQALQVRAEQAGAINEKATRKGTHADLSMDAVGHRKEIVKLLHQAAYGHSRWKVFSDFVSMSACAISNAVDLANRDEREAEYLRIVKSYTPEQLALFPTMLGHLTLGMEAAPRDMLGEIFMELELGSDRAGQFFTPTHVCQLMAQLQVDDRMRQLVKDKGFLTVQEPACGAGATVIGLANTMREAGINYQQQIHVTATDIDPVAAQMAYVQFSLMHIPAIVVHGNTLSLETYGVWHTPAHVLGFWDHRLRRAERSQAVGPHDDEIENEDVAPDSPGM